MKENIRKKTGLSQNTSDWLDSVKEYIRIKTILSDIGKELHQNKDCIIRHCKNKDCIIRHCKGIHRIKTGLSDSAKEYVRIKTVLSDTAKELHQNKRLDCQILQWNTSE